MNLSTLAKEKPKEKEKVDPSDTSLEKDGDASTDRSFCEDGGKEEKEGEGQDERESLVTSPVEEILPKGLLVWRDALSQSKTAAQLSMCLHMLQACIAWDKSIMKAVSLVQS